LPNSFHAPKKHANKTKQSPLCPRPKTKNKNKKTKPKNAPLLPLLPFPADNSFPFFSPFRPSISLAPFQSNPPNQTQQTNPRNENRYGVPEGGAPAWPAQPVVRGWRLDWGGTLAMFFYLCAFIFYLYVRIAKTLDLGGYTWYGVLVLGVEIMGASTTFLYGLNIVARPVHEPARPDDEVPGLVLVDHPYHVRVLVPVYKESLDIVAKTISAALAAKLPRGCGRTVYLCDDGKDAAKRRWCEAAGDDVVYVSGRTRKPGEMNGKSANLNNCLSHIYPEDLAMPPQELVCIFDADQVANADFFLKTLPLFDAGDDVGMVLSPQVSLFFFSLSLSLSYFVLFEDRRRVALLLCCCSGAAALSLSLCSDSLTISKQTKTHPN